MSRWGRWAGCWCGDRVDDLCATHLRKQIRHEAADHHGDGGKCAAHGKAQLKERVLVKPLDDHGRAGEVGLPHAIGDGQDRLARWGEEAMQGEADGEHAGAAQAGVHHMLDHGGLSAVAQRFDCDGDWLGYGAREEVAHRFESDGCRVGHVSAFHVSGLAGWGSLTTARWG